MAHNARARGAKRGAHRQLRHALDVSSQHEESEVRTHGHQKEGHRDEKSGQDRLYVAEECVAERDRDDSTASQLVGIFACQSGHHGCELRLRPCRWHLVLKSTNHVDRAQQPVCEPLPIDDERHKNVGILKQREVKLGR